MKIIDISDKNSVKISAEALMNEGIIIFPTDTVYGIGCLMNDKAIKKLYKIKNRPLSQPTAILFNKKIYDNLSIRVESNINGLLLNKYPEGRVTIISDIKKYNIKFPDILIKGNKVGVRIPNDKWLQKLIDKVGPIVAASANKKGKTAPRSFIEIDQKIIQEADLTVKTDHILSDRPSTVYDIETNKIIRE